MITWIVLIGGTMGLSLWATSRVRLNYARFGKLAASSGMSGAEAAQRILATAGIHDVTVAGQDATLSDHYDPIHKRLVLSRENYTGRSVAALGIAAHECGHAIQHKTAYAPLKWRSASIGLVRIANPLCLWLPMIGMIFLGITPTAAFAMMGIGWGIIMLFNLVTLPVEFDATRRAKAILRESGMIQQGEEEEGVDKVLDAAGWTYVAAFITSLAFMLYYLLPFLMGGRRG
jgi:Zn-dependent membrane protease YugP